MRSVVRGFQASPRSPPDRPSRSEAERKIHMRALIGGAALLGLALAAAGVASSLRDRPGPWPGVTVPVMRRLGDLPPPAETVTVAVSRDGKFAVDGVPC